MATRKAQTIEFSVAEQPTEEFAIPAGGWDTYVVPSAGAATDAAIVLTRGRRHPLALAGLLAVVLVVGALAGALAVVVVANNKSSSQTASEPSALSIPTGLPSVAPQSIPSRAPTAVANQSSAAPRAAKAVTTPAATVVTRPATTPVTASLTSPRGTTATPVRAATSPVSRVAAPVMAARTGTGVQFSVGVSARRRGTTEPAQPGLNGRNAVPTTVGV